MALTPQPTIRTPILDYALTHPIAVYAPPVPIVDPATVLAAESNAILQAETGNFLELDIALT